MTRVLLVDDEQILLEIGKEFLESRHGMTVDQASSGREGLAMLDESRPDIIVSDFQMPGMDGTEFLKNVRASGNRVPFILFTGRDRDEVAMSSFNNGCDLYLNKGCNAAVQYRELAIMIHRLTLSRDVPAVHLEAIPGH